MRINKFFETDLTIKVNVKRERRFDRPTVIFKLHFQVNFQVNLKMTPGRSKSRSLLTLTFIVAYV